MKKSLAGGLVAAAALLVVFGSGSAEAVNELNGMTYEKAQGLIVNSGAASAIRSRQGSYLPTEQCIVIGSKKARALDGSGRAQGNVWYLDLDCNDTTALNGHPGTSAAELAQTDAGRFTMKRHQQAAQLSENYAQSVAAGQEPYCAKGEDERSACVRICSDAKTCSAELLEFLGV